MTWCVTGLTVDAQDSTRAIGSCTPDTPLFSSPYCAELVAVPDLRGARGAMQLAPIVTPFGVSVDSAGHPRVRLTLTIEGLPRPASLGAYTAYVAWAYSLTMDREHRLGMVGNGSTALGEMPADLMQFRILVSAESSASVQSRGGKLVMRATSPSALLLAHRDAMAPFLTGSGGSMTHGEHAAHWPAPANDPRITPTPGMGTMFPSVAPISPTAAPNAIPTRPRELVRLAPGDTLTLTASLVARRVAGKTFLLYGYNGQIPGPLISVSRGTEVVVRFINAIDQPSTIHWHGVRLENRFDGTPHVTQEPVAPGDSFIYRVRFPDAGVYWYHPHVREDMQQDLGLYGNILVRSAARAPAHREEVLALDDLALDSLGALLPHGAAVPTHALMGRFGNVLLVNGEPSYTLGVRRGEVVRFYLTNVANARLLNLSFRGGRLKLVGSDIGNFERQSWTTHVTLAPAERYIVDARFDVPGRHAIVNHVQWLDHARGTYQDVADTLGFVQVSQTAAPPLEAAFDQLRRDAAVTREVAPLRRHVARAPDRTLSLGLRLKDVSPTLTGMLAGMSVPVDWNDGMPQMHWALTGREVEWTITDERGRENMAIEWRFKRGEVLKLRIVNRFDVAHAMAHPIHLHGQRFVVLARNGVPNETLGWKDTAVLPAGETMDLLVELANPGRWMLHCHIAEH
ncbi:MAG: multicopper oxidase family protein, partial [Gemmatimonadaceae bacterium]